MPSSKRNRLHALEQSALYKVNTRKKLAEILFCSVNDFDELYKQEGKYKRRWKPKHDDKAPWRSIPPSAEEADDYRPIDIPVPKLKRLQSRIAYLLARIETPAFLFSPVKGLSYVDNAAAHRYSVAYRLLDIADYFPSCRAGRVGWFFRTKMKCAPDVAHILVMLTTDNDCLPQGSPCSPVLAYFSNMKMWDEIDQLVRAENCVLSVYADDITISGSLVRETLVWSVKQVVHKNGFELKEAKEISLIKKPADITGVIVRDGRLRLPNRQYKKLSELLEKKKQPMSKKEREKLENQLRGRRAQRAQIENI